MIELLLDQRGAEMNIIKDVLEAAARNTRSGKAVPELLPSQPGARVDKRGRIEIAEDVVTAAAGNTGSGKKVMELLFPVFPAAASSTISVMLISPPS